MTQPETDDHAPENRTTLETFHEWRKQPANTSLTNGRLLGSRIVWTVFLALAVFVGYRQIRLDNQVTRDRVDAALVREVEDCLQTNEIRELAKEVAEGDVKQDQASLDSDRASWHAIDDLFPEGIPEPARTTVFAGLQTRQDALNAQSELVDVVYTSLSCTTLADVESGG